MLILLPLFFICNLIFIEAFDPFVYNSKDPCSRHCYYDYHVPVCGSDDVTYFNQCVMKVYACWAGVEIVVAYHGKCYPKEEEYTECEYRCPKLFSPVCGTDDKTYNNECLLNQERCYNGGQVNKQYDGFCLNKNSYTAACENRISSKFQPVCGTDGVSYINRDVLSKTACRNLDVSLRVQYFGECGQKRRARWRCRSVMKKEFLYEPVCGSDSRTHENTDILEYRKCLTKQTHLAVMYKGECRFKNKHPDHDISEKTTNSREEPTLSPDSKQWTKKPPILPPPPTPPRPPPSFTRSSPTKLNTNIGKEPTAGSNTNTLAAKGDVTTDIDTGMKTTNKENGFRPITNEKTEEMTSQPDMTSFPYSEESKQATDNATTLLDELITDLVSKPYTTKSTVTIGSTYLEKNGFVTNGKTEEMTSQPEGSKQATDNATTPLDELITDLVSKPHATQSTVTIGSTYLENGFVTNGKTEEMTSQTDMKSFQSEGSKQATDDTTTSSDDLITNIVTNPYATQSAVTVGPTYLVFDESLTTDTIIVSETIDTESVSQTVISDKTSTSDDKALLSIASRTKPPKIEDKSVPFGNWKPTPFPSPRLRNKNVEITEVSTEVVTEQVTILVTETEPTPTDSDVEGQRSTKSPVLPSKSVDEISVPQTMTTEIRQKVNEIGTENVTEKLGLTEESKSQKNLLEENPHNKEDSTSATNQPISDKTNVKELHKVVAIKSTSIPVLLKTEGVGDGLEASTVTNRNGKDNIPTAVTYVIVTEPITMFDKEVTSV